MGYSNNDFKSTDPTTYSFRELLDLKEAVDESVIVAITNKKGIITYANKRFCEISQYSEDELIGQDHKILNSGIHPKKFFKDMWKTIGSGLTWYGEVCNKAKDGSLYWVQTTIVPFLDKNNKPYQYIAIRTDITAQKDIEKATYIAYHDDLTGLPNRRHLNKSLQEEIEFATVNKKSFALFIINVNRFKNINEELGHFVGDLFLVELANRFMDIDTMGGFYRQNSDEFVFILKDTRLVSYMAKKVIALFDESFKIQGYEFFASVSIGISQFPQDGETIEDLMKRADAAVFNAKSQRTSTYLVYEPNMKYGNDKWLVLETRLHRALNNHSLYIHYQPKFELQSGKMVGVEALLRWTDEELGPIPPSRFIPLAEQCGLINDIGVWVLKQASLQMKKWNEKYGTDFHVAVNISPIHLSSIGFTHMLEEVINETGIKPDHLEIEITEMSLMDYTDDLLTTITRIRELGVRISIDDFGTGYSSLSYLKKFPVNTLKIDRSFVNDIITEQSGIAMVAAIISLAHALNLMVVAEGVEEEAELHVLRECGCNFVQGYYFSKPLDDVAFEQKLIEELSPRFLK